MLDLLYCFQISVDAGLSKADRPAFVRLPGVLTVPASRSWESLVRLTGSSAARWAKMVYSELDFISDNSRQQKSNPVFTRKLFGLSGLMI